MPIQNLIFDWSGTLADDFSPVFHATNQIFQHYGRPPWSEADFREKFYLPFPDFYKEYLPEATLPELDFHYHRAFHSLQENIPLLPFAKETLEFAQLQGMKIFLLSTIHPEHWKKQADILGVRDFFTQPYTGALDKRETIQVLMAEHGLRASETLFAGDMKHDIDTAKSAGVTSCALLTGYDSLEKLKKSGPDILFRDLSGLLDYLKRHRQDDAGHPIPTVGALIFNTAGEVLMIQTYKWSNLWGIPGGKIKKGETAVAALAREIEEETGLALEDVRPVETQDCINSPEFFKPAHFLLLNFTALSRSLEVALNQEADKYLWIAPQDALDKLPLNKPTRHLIETVLKTGRNPYSA